MVDIQNQIPEYGIPIDNVGIDGLLYPVTVLDKQNKSQRVTAKVSMSVNLPENFRGTHMSRFVEILNQYRDMVTYEQLGEILNTMQKVFKSKSSNFNACFPYFIEKTAPVSGISSLLPVDVEFTGRLEQAHYDFMLTVKTPVTILCPCSKEISERGAHNQRAVVSISVRFSSFVWIEELVEIAESSASAPIFSLIKRPDEKHLTELAYDNPRFVEDIVRMAAHRLLSMEHIKYFRVYVESQESIHSHTAFSVIEHKR
jgi:GTP cyclohydrolase I